MQPEQNPFPADYLDQIATKQTTPGISNKRFFGVIIAGVIIVILAFVFILSNSGSSDKTSLERLGLRLASLQTVADDAQDNIKSSKLQSINGNLSTYLVNANRDIATSLEAKHIKLKKADKKLVAEEDGSELMATLEDARLNAVFDRTYTREMTYRLEKTSLLMNALYKSTRNEALKTSLANSYKDIDELQKQFADFKATSR